MIAWNLKIQVHRTSGSSTFFLSVCNRVIWLIPKCNAPEGVQTHQIRAGLEPARTRACPPVQVQASLYEMVDGIARIFKEEEFLSFLFWREV